MSDRTVQRQKSTASSFTNPSLASPGIPTLANPIRGFGSQINTAPPQTVTEVAPDLQQVQSADEQLSEPIKEKRLSHDISRISLRRPQAKLTVGEPTDQYEQEADWMANRVMSMPAPTLQQKIIPEKQTQEEVQTKPFAGAITPLVQRETIPEQEEEIQTKSLNASIQSELIQPTVDENYTPVEELNYTPAPEEFNHTPGEDEAAEIGREALQTVGYEKVIKTALEAGFLRVKQNNKEPATVQAKLQATQDIILRQAAEAVAWNVFTRYAVAAGIASQVDSPAPGPGDVVAIGILIVGLAAAGYILMSSGGTPRNNQAQNKQFADAVREIERRIGRKLSQDEIRRLHDTISGQDYGYHDIVEEGVGMFGN
ncbi:hypothetical protein [Nostoc sp. WHI]|uniref:hypothetical protein n=1 Tax=Nostoc sp. WHI TaxID=2650611 RepID=UPI0018C7A085|nr:hypothetical protein [Nostoc sp. WHI]MBG1265342.1 hypothetical protein [Nostoc sp. WHI]